MIPKTKIKYIQSLGQKKFRDKEKRFLVEGPKIIQELLLSNEANIIEIIALEEWIREHQQELGSTSVTEAQQYELEKLSQLSAPNKVIAVVEQFDRSDIQPAGNEIILALDCIQDPGNLGTIIRIADWFAIPRIVCSYDCADIYNPKVVQSSMGSVLRVPVYYCDLQSWLQQQDNIRVFAAVMEGEDISKVNINGKAVIVLGNESKGISNVILEIANVRITIPGKGKAESLNAAVAAGIILSHLT